MTPDEVVAALRLVAERVIGAVRAAFDRVAEGAAAYFAAWQPGPSLRGDDLWEIRRRTAARRAEVRAEDEALS